MTEVILANDQRELYRNAKEVVTKGAIDNKDGIELFIFEGKMPKITANMQKSDRHFPPNNTLEGGANAIRAYWNRKNLRLREAVQT